MILSLLAAIAYPVLLILLAIPTALAVTVIAVAMVIIEVVLVTTYHLRQHKKKGD